MFETFAITPEQATIFGLLTLPVTVWVIYTDVTTMKIKNVAVLAMLGIFAVAGLFLLPLSEYAWRWSHFAVVIVIGYLMHVASLPIGAGDAKYAAAIAPFVAIEDTGEVAVLFFVLTVALLVLFFVARSVLSFWSSGPNWTWVKAEAGGTTALGKTREVMRLKTPFGLALASTISSYFLLAALA
jgi:prepilin peptidase CpaA